MREGGREEKEKNEGRICKNGGVSKRREGGIKMQVGKRE